MVTLLPPGPPVFSPWLVPVKVPGPVVLPEPEETVWLLEEAEL